MSPTEFFATAFGLISVVLTVRESIWSMPTGIVSVALFTALFYSIKLYPDTGLQVVFLALTAYGWYAWTRTTGGQKVVPTTRITIREAATLSTIGLLAYLGLALFFSRYTDASLPWVDSLTTTMSLIAQYLLSKKVIENWYIWIAADLIMIPLYFYKGVMLTGGLYCLFLALAIVGLISWKRALCLQPAW